MSFVVLLTLGLFLTLDGSDAVASQTGSSLEPRRIYTYVFRSKLVGGSVLGFEETEAKIVLKNVEGSEFLVSVLEYKQIGLEEANDGDLPLTQDAFVGLWLSFEYGSNGMISAVEYREGGDAKAISFLKTVVALFNAKRESLNDSYVSLEVDHMGKHLTRYSVQRDKNSLAIKRSFEEKTAVSVMEEKKVLYLNSNNKTILKINVNQTFRFLPSKQTEQDPPPKLFSFAEELGTFPSFTSVFYQANLTLLSTTRSMPSTSKPKGLTSSSLEVKPHERNSETFPSGEDLRDTSLSSAEIVRSLMEAATSGEANEGMVKAVENFATDNSVADSIRNQAWLTLGSLTYSCSHENPELASLLVEKISLNFRKLLKHRSDISKQVALIDSLGNTGHRDALDTILGVTNGSVHAPSQVRRAAVQALRKYDCIRSADTLKATALLDPNESVRKTASYYYSRHPRKDDDDWVATENPFTMNGTMKSTPIHHSVVRRSSPDLVPSQHEINLATPSVHWHKRLGTKNIGADFGTASSGKMDLLADSWSTDFKADLQTRSWVNAKIGYLGQETDLLEISTCFNGDFAYDANVIKNYDLSAAQAAAEEFDVIAASLVSTVHSSASALVSKLASVSRGDSLPALFEDVKTAGNKIVPSAEALNAKLAQAFDQIRLYGGLMSTERARSAFKQFRSLQGLTEEIVTNLYKVVFDGAYVDLPHAAREIDVALTEIQKLLETFVTSPQQTLDAILHSTLRLEAALEVVRSVEKAISLACAGSAGDCSSWLGVTDVTDLLQATSQLLASDFQAGKIPESSLAEYTESELLAHQQEQEAFKALQQTFDTLLPSALSDFSSAFADFKAAFNRLQRLLIEADNGYTELRKSYEMAKAETTRLFGTKFHRAFPRVFRSCNDTCGCGVYPTTTGDNYEYGIDLLTAADDQTIVAPFAGVITIRDKTIRLLPTDFTLINYEVVLANVDPAISITNASRYVRVGQFVGRALSGCGSTPFVHVTIKQRKASESDVDTFVDPSAFVLPVDLPHVTPKIDCNDGSVLFKGHVVQRFLPLVEPTFQRVEKPVIRNVNLPLFDDIKKDFGAIADRSVTSVEEEVSRGIAEFDWETSVAAVRSLHPHSWSDPVSVQLPSASTAISEMSVSEVEDILQRANALSSLKELRDSVSALETRLLAKTCDDVKYMTSSQIQDWLTERGLDTDGLRYELANRLRQIPSSGCPDVESGLPTNSSTVYSVDGDCRGISACMILQYGFARLPALLTVSYASCRDDLALRVDDTWTETIRNASTSNISNFEVTGVSAGGKRLYLELSTEVVGSDLSLVLRAKLCDPNFLDCSRAVDVAKGLRFSTDCQPDAMPQDFGVRKLNLHQLIGKMIEKGLPSRSITNLLQLFANAAVYRAEQSHSQLDASFETEFPPVTDLVLSSTHNVTQQTVEFFKYGTSFKIGAASTPLEFDVLANGSYSAVLDFQYSALGKTLTSTLTTTIAAEMRGYTRSGAARYEEISLTGKLIEARYPTTTKMSFNKWPLEISTDMHLTLVPTDLVLSTKIIRETVNSKRTVYSKDIWNFQTPPLDYTTFDYRNERSDATPPVPMPLFCVDPTAPPSDAATCHVRQLVGRHHRNPAFELGSVVYEDLSGIKLSYRVGTYDGGSDVVVQTPLAGPVFSSTARLVSGKRLYFTIVAVNQQGLTALTSCELSTYDTTLPSGWIRPSYLLSSHPSYIGATLAVYDDSPLRDNQEEMLSIGTSSFSSEIRRTNFSSSILTTEKDGTLIPLNAFGSSQDGSRSSSPVKVFSSIGSASDCAKECLALAQPQCKSFDYVSTDALCLIHDSVLGADEELQSAASTKHYTRIGVGNTAVLEHSGLALEHGKLYHFSAKITNKLGYSTVLSSSPVLIDLTPPSLSQLHNIQSDFLRADGCPAAINQRCVNPSLLSNHRIISDGPGSQAVFWGHSPYVEAAFTTATSYVSANWKGFYDNETGIWGYTWCIGSALGNCDVYGPEDPQVGTRLDTDLTYVAVTNAKLTHGKTYFVTIQALNRIVHGGALVTSLRHSIPLVVDTTPPSIYDVAVRSFDHETGSLAFTYNASDAESGIRSVYFGLGKSPGDVEFQSWQSIDPMKYEHSTSVNITKDTRIYLLVKTVNRAGLSATASDTNGLLIPEDVQLPTGFVLDGVEGDDVDFLQPGNPACLHWRGFTHESLKIQKYVVDLGTRPYGNDASRTDAQINTTRTCLPSHSLLPNVTYYFTVTALYESMRSNVSSSSDGFLIDATPPTGGWIRDGVRSLGYNLNISSDPMSISAYWGGFEDAESNLRYTVAVFRRPSTSASFTEIASQPLPGDEREINWFHLQFDDGDYVYVAVTAINGAGLNATVQSDGFLVDTTAPEVVYVRDGAEDDDLEFQANDSRIDVAWKFVDGESRVSYYEVAVLQLVSGSRSRIWPPVLSGNPSAERISNSTVSSWSKTGLSLMSGEKYVVSVTAVNRAGLSANQESSGIVIDNFPPNVVSLKVLDSVASDDAESVLISTANLIHASWSAVDDETYVSEYFVDIIDDKTGASVLPSGDFYSVGLRTSSVIDQLNLKVDNFRNGSFYRVLVKAVDAAGNVSPIKRSKKIGVASGDSAGIVRDGPDLVDLEFDDEASAITVTFDGFVSELCEIDRYEWAIGYTDTIEALQPFTSAGIVVTEERATRDQPGSGRAQALLPGLAETAEPIVTTVRAITLCGTVFQSSSDGIQIDTSPPDVSLTHFGSRLPNGREVAGSTYFAKPIPVSASWTVNEDTGREQTAASYWAGTFPGGDDLAELSETPLSRTEDGAIQAALDGLPTFITASVTNDAGLQAKVTSDAIVVDQTRPIVGKVTCPSVLESANSTLMCSWSGFHDPQSGIDVLQYSVGYFKGDASVRASTDLPASATFFATGNLDFDKTRPIFVTIKAVNLLGLKASGFSDEIRVDETPPQQGQLIVRADVAELLGNVTTLRYAENCVTLPGSLLVSWHGFDDVESKISRYEIGLGTIKGATDVHDSVSLAPTADKYEFVDINLSPYTAKKVFVTLRAYNELGVYAQAIHDGVVYAPSVKSTLAFVHDGTGDSDSDYQVSTSTAAATWNLASFCPLRELKWEVRRADDAVGVALSEQDVNSRAQTSNRFAARDGETYRSILYAKDSLNRTYTLKSNGTTIAVRFLKPATVRDGKEKDVDYQSSSSTISANWDAFGESGVFSQHIERYEIAIGNDKRYASNVVPFTDVGLVTTHTLNNLKLTPRSVRYYITVRGYSASGAWTDSTSDGVFVGYAEGIRASTISLPLYQGIASEFTAHWAEFESENLIEKYDFAVGKVMWNATVLRSFCNDLKSEYSDDFDVIGFQSVGTDTVVTLTGISLQHNSSYFVSVRAVDRAGNCLVTTSENPVLVDTTPPEKGVILVGNDAAIGKSEKEESARGLSFVGKTDEIGLSLAQFRDGESGISLYRVRLFEWNDCGNYSASAMTSIGEDVTLDYAEVVRYSFRDIKLNPSMVYVVKIETVNRAGLASVAYSSPIQVDDTDPVGGNVKDGLSWTGDIGYQFQTNKVDGTFTYSLSQPIGEDEDPCFMIKSYPLVSPDSNWKRINQKGLLALGGDNNLEYQEDQVQFGPDGTNITLERPKDGSVMLSGAYGIPVDIWAGEGTISFSLKGPSSSLELDAYAVPSVVFWSGPEGTVGDFDASDKSSTNAGYDSLGMQLRPAYVASDGSSVAEQILLWSRFSNGSSDHQTIQLPLSVDRNAFHKYTFSFEKDETTVDFQSSVTFSFDGDRLAVLHNLPSALSKPKMIFHVWNRDGHVPPPVPFNPPRTTIAVKDVTFSATPNNSCSYGTPFYDWESPVVAFEAGLGRTPLTDDVKSFQTIFRPCRLCVKSSCPTTGCDANCTDRDLRNVSFSLTNLRLAPYANHTTFFQPEILSLNSQYRQPAVYFLSVKAQTASGRSVVVSSNGITIDVTPPVPVFVDHIDVAWDLYEPTRHQSSNSTIALRWRFYDLESFVVDYQWAVGSRYGTSDLQTFRSVGLKTFAVNNQFDGIIRANRTYYASVRATNGAGLSDVAHSLGVTYVASALDPDVFNQTIAVVPRFAIETEKNLTAAFEIERIKRTDRLGVSWGDLSLVDTIYWRIGTSPESEDVLPEMDVGFAGGSEALIENASLILNGQSVGHVTDLIARVKPGYYESENFFRLEPGRVTHHRIKVCDLSHQCFNVAPSPVAVIRDEDVVDISASGEDLRLSVARLRSADVVSQADEPHSVTVETTGGMQPSSAIVIGLLSSQSITSRYSPEEPYVSNFFETKTETERHLAGRLTGLAGPSFFVSILNLESLQGPLILNASFDTGLDWSDADPWLVFWDLDANPPRWVEVSATCGIPDTIDFEKGRIIGRMCSDVPVSSDYVRRKRRETPTNVTSFLNRETQFAIARTLNDTVNTPPRLALPPEGITVYEDVGTGSTPFQIAFVDAEKDAVTYSVESLPRLGTATIDNATGLLTYVPCSNCIGTDQVLIRITEIPFADHQPLSDEALLTVRITNVDDLPRMFLFLGVDEGDAIDPSTSSIAYVEANRTTGSRVARVAAYDFDGLNDDLLFRTTTSFGTVNVSVWLDAVGSPGAFPVDWKSANVSAGDYIGDLAFLAADLFYRPSSSSNDEIKLSVRHLEGTFSSIYTVKIVFLSNPCLNDGQCGGSVLDPNCTDRVAREASFDGYTCKCKEGYGGTYCEKRLVPPVEPTPRVCPEGVPVVHCEMDPCDGAYCPSHPSANCTANYCGACTAEWFVDGRQVQCTAGSNSNVCLRPIRTAICSDVTCPCELEQRPCPSDAVYVMKRTSDCCVQWECSCPNGSCPYGMQCGDGVQPNPEWRGHGAPGRCCPLYNYTDIDECGENKGGCEEICVNTPYSFYCTCPQGSTLAKDSFSCGVCVYDSKEYKIGDRTPFGIRHICECSTDENNAERWHCDPAPETTGCIYNGWMYWPGESVLQKETNWICMATDSGNQWIKQ